MTGGAVAKERPWSGRYPPLIAVVLAIALAVFALPSALNLPLANPGQSLEYAPVPGNSGQAPPEGNLAGLGLGQTGTGGSGGEGTTPATPPPGDLSNTSLQTSPKRCVGNPPRQTEDPLSPPCVAFFSGDNGGATHAGVSAQEIRIVYYFDGGNAGGTSNGDDQHTPGSLYDLASPPQSGDPVFVSLVRLYQKYFNARYQTYGRFVHFWVHFGSQNPPTTASRGADAAQDLAVVKPYAVIAAVSQYLDNYVHPMSAAGVTAFLGNPAAGIFGSTVTSASYYAAHPGLVWSFFPSVEELARLNVTYICSKVLPYSVSFSGNTGENRGPRKLGLWTSSDTSHPDLVRFGELVQKGVEDCGGGFAVVGATNVDNGDNGGDSADNCSSVTGPWARFKQQQVTTIIWTAGYTSQCELNFAQGIAYFPELVIAGEGLADTNLAGATQGPPSEMSQARTVSTWTAVAQLDQQPCVQAAREVDPTVAEQDLQSYGCAFYADFRELFTGIQVAGPHLDPTNVNQGYHAIPGVPSGDPKVPACFYQSGDYTCVKDAQAEWWDASGRADNSQQAGCWRMMQAGRRYLAGTWPSGDVEAQHGGGDPCNSVGITP